MCRRLTTIISFCEEWVMTEAPDLKLAHLCLERAVTDIGGWLACVVRGELATVPPFGQMFIYQLNTQGKLGDEAFAVGALYRVYYRTAGGTGEPPDASCVPGWPF
jgi:hypothetical protein